MQPTKQPGPEYHPVSSMDLSNKRLNLALNLLGVAALVVASWLLYQLAGEIKPGILAPSSFLLLGGPELLALIAGLAAVIVLHELIHGLFFWGFTGERFQFGIRPFYAFAAAPNWFIPRSQFVIIGLAPFIIITILGIGLIWALPLSAAAVALVAVAVNAAGSTGDLVVVGWLYSKPPGRLIRDQGDRITKFNIDLEGINVMAEQWMRLMAHYQVDDEASRLMYSKIDEAYGGEGRYYHNMTHIENVLDSISELRSLANDYHAIQLAVWFHDIVYETERQDNEARSASYGYEALIELGIDEVIAARVRDLILVTADHRAPDGDMDAKILIDADLAPLAADQALFAIQSEDIRKEAAGMPVEAFIDSRRRFLNGMLDRERIYLTPQFHNSLEEKARENIKGSLAALP